MTAVSGPRLLFSEACLRLELRHAGVQLGAVWASTEPGEVANFVLNETGPLLAERCCASKQGS